MNLDESQRKIVAAWIAEGLKLSEIQTRLASELGVKMTYMEVRFLVDDLKLTPKDVEPPKPPQALGNPPPAGVKSPLTASSKPDELAPSVGGRVSVSVDQIARPGALVSGKVTFSDGQQADWNLDQSGRLGVAPKQQGYKPAAIDVQEFQLALQDELAKIGF
jgi:hypothetical protein